MVFARTTAAVAHGAVVVGLILLAAGCSGSDEAQPNSPAPPSIVESTVPNTEIPSR